MLPVGDDNSARRIVPIVTYILILLNVLFFFVELSAGDAFIMRWAFVPGRFLANPGAEFLTLFTSMFMHAGWLHLGGNMLYLWIFGDNIEDRFGHTGFLIGYLVCGLAATAAQLAFSLDFKHPEPGRLRSGRRRPRRLHPAVPESPGQCCTGTGRGPGPRADRDRALVRSAALQQHRLHRQFGRYRGRGLHGTHRRVCRRRGADVAVPRQHASALDCLMARLRLGGPGVPRASVGRRRRG